MLDVQVDISGPLEMIQGVSRRLDSPRPMMQMLGGLLEDYEREVFASRGFGKWAPDDRDTVELKGGSGRVLVDTGNLLANLTSARVSGDTVTVDAGDAFYARFLKDGDRGMPKRDPAPEPDSSHLEKWAEQLLGYLVDGRRR